MFLAFSSFSEIFIISFLKYLEISLLVAFVFAISALGS